MDLVALTGEREEKVTVRRDGHQYLVVVGESTYRVDAVTVHGEREQRVLSLVVDGRQHEVSVAAEAEGRYRVAVGAVDRPVELLDPLTHLAREAHGGQGRSGVETVTAYMPGRVVAVLVEEGAELVNSTVRGPAVIGRNTRLVDTYVGPFTSIAADCVLEHTEIEHSVVLERCRVTDIPRIEGSLLGRDVEITREDRKPKAYRFMLGDHSQVGI